MRQISGLVLAIGTFLAGALVGPAQVSSDPHNAAPVSAGAAGEQQSGASGAAGGQAAAAADTRTDKQKALAKQAERLFDMATELKVQVDKTNKNILSLKVVEKAEEIEILAKGMKAEARK